MSRQMCGFSLIIFYCFLFYSCKKDLIEPRDATQVTVPTTHDLNAIMFVNDTLGFIAGGEKYTSTDLLTTHDGGKTWSAFSIDGENRKGVYGLAWNGSNAYAIGYDGKFYTREQQNNDWKITQTAYWEWLQDITFTSANKAFVIAGEGYRAGRIYQTDTTGNLILKDTFEFQLVDIQFANANTGYISGYGAVLKTQDGGSSWQLQDVQGDLFRSVSCVDADNVWIAGYNGTIIHTSDGGANWERQRNGDNPLKKKYRFRAIVFKDLNTGYAAGDGGLLVKTTDGGKHWSEFKHLTDSDFKCMTIHPDGSIWVAGANGVVFHIRE
jgi:photosystem II stability/assembly factor-like uncharacterized protein